jgi:hypothetical protein
MYHLLQQQLLKSIDQAMVLPNRLTLTLPAGEEQEEEEEEEQSDPQLPKGMMARV